MNLPNALNYNESLPSLPNDTNKIQMVISPSNGGSQSFSPGSIVTFDLPQNGYLVPDSLMIRYKMNIVGANNGAGYGYGLIGCPVYVPFLREEIVINSNVVESINQYNQIHCMMVNLKYDIAKKYGQQASYGWSNGEFSSNPTLSSTLSECFDGRANYGLASVAYNENISLSAPLPCLLSYSKKLIPLGLMPSVRLNLTIDSISNIFNTALDQSGGTTTYSLPTAFSLNNIEIVYDMMTFNSEVEDIVRQNEKIYIKSQSFSNSSQTLPIVSGSTSLTFNTRLASIKGAFLNMSSNDTSKCTNKSFDSVDLTKGNGDVSLSISGVNYPQRAFNTANHKNAIFQALRDTVGTIFDNHNSLSISNLEWKHTDNTVTNLSIPGKFIFGFNLEKMHSNNLLTGISSQQSAINVNMNFGTQTSSASTLNLILNYDALLEIDMVNRQCAIKQ